MRSLRVNAWVGCFLSVAAFVHAVPKKISIVGSVEPIPGYEIPCEVEPLPHEPPCPPTVVPPVPINGTFTVRVDFYSNDSDTSPPLLTTDTEVAVNNGRFVSIVDLPSSLLVYDKLYYRMALDIDGDGFAATDYFDRFFEILSVPFSLSGQSVTSFETGMGSFPYGSSRLGYPIPDTVIVLPFSTPPGGVRFNRFASRELLSDVSSFGIYDDEGKLVYSTDGAAPTLLADPFVWNTPEINLEPSRVYFAAYTTTAESIFVRVCMIPTLPSFGKIISANLNGHLPATVELDQIQPPEPSKHADFMLTFGLYFIENPSKAMLREKQQPLSKLSDETLRQIRAFCATRKECDFCSDPAITEAAKP